MKMSGFSKNCWERSALQYNIDLQKWMRKKNRIKRKKTIYKYILLVPFGKFVRAIFVQFNLKEVFL